MEVEKIDDEFIVDAPWLKSPVSAKTFEEAYELAMASKRTQ